MLYGDCLTCGKSKALKCHVGCSGYRESAALFLRRWSDGKLLSISRGENLLDWGMPGGKRDPEDESTEHACAREALEEAGVVVDVRNLRPIFKDFVSGEGRSGYFCTTFTVVPQDAAKLPAVLPVTREGTVRWIDPLEIVNTHATFRSYNRRMFDALNIWGLLRYSEQ